MGPAITWLVLVGWGFHIPAPPWISNICGCMCRGEPICCRIGVVGVSLSKLFIKSKLAPQGIDDCPLSVDGNLRILYALLQMY